MSCSEDKKELRRHMRETIKAMSAEDKARESAAICSKILSSSEWSNARKVLLYDSMQDEVDTASLVAAAKEAGKEVLMPAATWQEMREEDLSSVALAIIPGRAFTRSGLRMGRGGGYYDRCMDLLKCPRWGIGFKCQIVPQVPQDEWDQPLDAVITAN